MDVDDEAHLKLDFWGDLCYAIVLWPYYAEAVSKERGWRKGSSEGVSDDDDDDGDCKPARIHLVVIDVLLCELE